VTERSVGGAAYGQFLVDVFEEWVRRDVGTVYVQLFDVTLEAFFGRHLLCIHAPTCGNGPALEHNGDLYSCDHFVYPEYKLGNIRDVHEGDLAFSEQQKKFGYAKSDSLPQYCRTCAYLELCWGECPKNRFIKTPDGEKGLNYLCAGLKMFYAKVTSDRAELARRLQR